MKKANLLFWKYLLGLANLAATNPTNYTTDSYLAGNYKIGNFTAPEFLGNLNFNDTAFFKKEDRPADYIPANFTATERISAGFAQ